MTRVVVRPRVQIAFLVVLSAAWTLLGVTYFTENDVVARRDWFGLGLGCLLVVTGSWGLWRATRMAVIIDPRGVLVRSLDSRDKVIPASDIQSVTIGEIGIRAGMPVYAPVLVLVPPGDSLPIRTLGTYALRDVEAKAEHLGRLLSRPYLASKD